MVALRLDHAYPMQRDLLTPRRVGTETNLQHLVTSDYATHIFNHRAFSLLPAESISDMATTPSRSLLLRRRDAHGDQP
jgi:hypothetical protein